MRTNALVRHQFVALGLVTLSVVYLLAFVPRGWVPHDEGMLGQAAERILAGEVPHVDFQEPYTGGLSWLHAAVFDVAGMDLVYLRWLLFVGAALAQLLTYLILRRFLTPLSAALAAWVALAWSFPNYFASLPSWWILICAFACLWAFIKFVETGLLRYAVAAGLAAGASILIKQTGLYILIALVISLLYGGGPRSQERVWWPGRLICIATAIIAAAAAALLITARLALADLLYLFLPILACSRLLLTTDGLRPSLSPRQAYAAPVAAVAAAAAVLALFVMPYVLNGQHGALAYGLFVLPQKRTQFASAEMPPAMWILAGVPLLGLIAPLPARLQRVRTSTWIGAAIGIGGLLLVGVSSVDAETYQVVWQSARALAALIPIAVAGMLLAEHSGDSKQRWIVFGCATMLAWASLVQLPFSAAIYFCYVAPLAVIAAVSVARHNIALSLPLGVYGVVLLAFAIAIMNRGYIFNLGLGHRPAALNVPLDVDRAGLLVSAEHAVMYPRVLDLIAAHIQNGKLVAGPDTPEVYFLAGRFSPTGTFYDFFDGNVTTDGAITDLPGWRKATVVILNHGRRFSIGPSADLSARVRQEFPNAEWAGPFEVRWR